MPTKRDLHESHTWKKVMALGNDPADIVYRTAAVTVIMLGLYASSLHSYILFHSLIEFTTIAIGFTLFILTVNARRFLTDGCLKALGIGYGLIALIDLLHSLAYKGMGVFPGYDANLPTQLWITARSLQAILLCVAPFFARRSLNHRFFFGISLVAVSASTVLVWAGAFPDCFIEGTGLTTFKIVSEYVISALLLVALFLFIGKRTAFNARVFKLIAVSILCTIASELAFTSYVSVYGPANMAGHFLKLAAFYLIYRALVVTGFQEPFELIFRDLKQAEQALTQEREFSRCLLESMADGVVACDAEGILTLFNRSVREWHGMDPLRLPSDEWAHHFDLFRSDGITPLPTDEVPLARAFRGEIVRDAGMAIKAKGQPIRFILANGSVIRDEAGQKLGAVVIMRDVTEFGRLELSLRKANEELEQRVEERTAELRGSEEKYRSLFDSANDVVFIHEIRDNMPGPFLEVNEVACRLLGYSREEFARMSPMELDDPRYRDRIAPAMARLVQEGQVIFETAHVARDGRSIPVEVSSRITEIRGRQLLVSIARDLSERKRAEAERQAQLQFFEGMDAINRAMQGANDLEQMMGDVLDVVLSTFACDRVFLLYPCDPEAETWSAPMARNRPEYPGMGELGIEMAMDSAVAETFRLLIGADGPVKFGPGALHVVPPDVAERFGVKCFMAMAIYPKVGKAWQFCIHQCSYARVWTMEEERLFKEIGRRLADSMTSLLMYRDLQEGEQRYRMVFENSPVSIWEEDFSGVQTFFDRLKKEGITDIEQYLDRHPDAVRHCAELAKITDVNRAALTLHGAANKEELFAGLVNTFTPESFDTFRQELVCLWHGGTEMVRDTVIKTLAGEPRHVTVYFSVCPGYEGTLARILVSLADISSRKQAEEAVMELNEELDRRVHERTAELEKANNELQKVNKLFVGRELRMVELKEKIKDLEKKNRA